MYAGSLVKLRAQEPGDAELYHRWIHDPEVIEHITFRYPMSQPAEREWVESNGKPGYARAVFAVEALDTGQLIGAVELSVDQPEVRRAVLGITLGDKSYWGRGYGTDTVRTMCRFGFDEMNVHRIYL